MPKELTHSLALTLRVSRNSGLAANFQVTIDLMVNEVSDSAKPKDGKIAAPTHIEVELAFSAAVDSAQGRPCELVD
jgi:hypothetical protein